MSDDFSVACQNIFFVAKLKGKRTGVMKHEGNAVFVAAIGDDADVFFPDNDITALPRFDHIGIGGEGQCVRGEENLEIGDAAEVDVDIGSIVPVFFRMFRTIVCDGVSEIIACVP